jgi:hypothetical protein
MKSREDSGFALLMVFLMAAVIAISLYMEIPRVAFQTQRHKEQLLMERGEQYKRAIGLFLRANKNTRWPASIDELESFNNQRFLRRRFIDPMTGKDDWRLVHIQNGILQDSLTVKKPEQKKQDDNTPNGFITDLQAIGDTGAQGGSGPVSVATRRRPSDGGPIVGPDGQPLPAGSTGPLPGALPPMPGASSGNLNQQNTTNPNPGFPPGVPQPGAIPSQPGAAAGQPIPVNGAPGLLGIPGIPGAPPQPGGQPANPVSNVPGMPGASGNQGININQQAQNAAANLLNGLLTSPRPGGLNGINGAGGQGTLMGGGIAGVASTMDADSIMEYNGHTNYKEWEFIYDPTKPRTPPNPLQGSPGTAVQQLGSMPGGNTGTPVANLASSPAGGIGTGIGAGATVPGALGAGPAAPGATTPATGTGSTQTPAGSSAPFGGGGAPTIRPGKK